MFHCICWWNGVLIGFGIYLLSVANKIWSKIAVLRVLFQKWSIFEENFLNTLKFQNNFKCIDILCIFIVFIHKIECFNENKSTVVCLINNEYIKIE